jgi:hypothetical protein
MSLRKLIALPVVIVSLGLVSGLAPLAQAHDVEAGPIWNQGDAQEKCPKVCRPPEHWNGQWRTTDPGKMSVCGCEGAAAASGGEDNALRKGEALSAQEALSQGRGYVAKMEETKNRCGKLQETARRKKDVLMLTCVNDKLVLVNGHIVVANGENGALRRMQEAIARQDDAARRHEFTRLTILYQKVIVLGTEAENCVGEDASYVGKTKVDVEVDPNIPENDPTQPQLPVPDVSRPPEASPFV